MSMTAKNTSLDKPRSERWLKIVSAALAAGLLAALTLLLVSPIGTTLRSGLRWLFAADSTQLWWYVTRSAGVIAYLLLWFSTAWGLAIPTKILTPSLSQEFTFDFHEFISLLTIGFVTLHIGVLLFDRYLPYTLWQVLIPFLSSYRPIWVGLGVISFYLILLVTITFYLRNRIGMKSFRSIHWLSFVAYLGVTLHGLYAGTDAPLAAMQLLYRGTALVIVFLTVYWLVMKLQKKSAPGKPPSTPAKQQQTPYRTNVPLRGRNQIRR
jgi:methionine sulfoxide reductase heme-binding subunit